MPRARTEGSVAAPVLAAGFVVQGSAASPNL
jgi:hypothetical protein